jgi:uncharacterized membrane protein YoaK (UPF0700 family)
VLLLVAIAGYVDAFGLMRFQTFVSFMSGNTTRAGLQIAQDLVPAALPALVAIVFFFAGVFGGTTISVRLPNRSRRISFAVSAGLIALFLVVARASDAVELVDIALLSLGMGVLNTSVTRIGSEPVYIGYVTGTLHRMADHAARAAWREALPDPQAPKDTHARRALLLAGVWTAFFFGAVLAGVGTPRFGADGLMLPLVALLSLIAWDARSTGVSA